MVARRLDRLEQLAREFQGRVLPFEHDVTAFQEVPAIFQRVTGELGGLDLIVYAAGVMPSVSPDEFDFSKDQAMIETNLLGAIAWLNQAAIRFQGTKSGSIVAIGSVAGDRGRAGQPVYNASKAGLATYMEALRNRLAKFGVRVVTIKPGPVRSEMTEGLDLKGAMSARQAASKILAKSRSTGEHYLKFSHRVIFALIRRIPSPIFRRLRL